MPNNMLAPPLGLVPPLANPGSATAMGHQMSEYHFLDTFVKVKGTEHLLI